MGAWPTYRVSQGGAEDHAAPFWDCYQAEALAGSRNTARMRSSALTVYLAKQAAGGDLDVPVDQALTEERP